MCLVPPRLALTFVRVPQFTSPTGSGIQDWAPGSIANPFASARVPDFPLDRDMQQAQPQDLDEATRMLPQSPTPQQQMTIQTQLQQYAAMSLGMGDKRGSGDRFNRGFGIPTNTTIPRGPMPFGMPFNNVCPALCCLVVLQRSQRRYSSLGHAEVFPLVSGVCSTVKAGGFNTKRLYVVGHTDRCIQCLDIMPGQWPLQELNAACAPALDVPCCGCAGQLHRFPDVRCPRYASRSGLQVRYSSLTLAHVLNASSCHSFLCMHTARHALHGAG